MSNFNSDSTLEQTILNNIIKAIQNREIISYNTYTDVYGTKTFTIEGVIISNRNPKTIEESLDECI